MGPTNSNSNQVAENKLAQLDDSDQDPALQQIELDLLVSNDISAKYLEDMEQKFFFDDRSRVIVVSGIAGNGKSHLLYDLFLRYFSPQDSSNILCNSDSDNKNEANNYRMVDLELYDRVTRVNIPFKPFASKAERFLINDLSEMSDAKSKNAFTKDCFDIITNDPSLRSKGKIILLGANSGALLNVFEDSLQSIIDMRKVKGNQELSDELKPFEWAKSKTEDQVDLYKRAITNLKLALMDHQKPLLKSLLQDTNNTKSHSKTDTEPPIVFFDTTNLYQIEDFNNIAYKILHHSAWDNCQQCKSRDACPIFNNRRLLNACNFALDTSELKSNEQSDAKQVLNAPFPRLVQLLLGLGEQLTIRNVFMLLSNTILGFVANNEKQASSQKPVLNCEMVQSTVFNNIDKFSLCYTPSLSKTLLKRLQVPEQELVWYSNPFDNFFGLNFVNFNKKLQKKISYVPKNFVIFDQFNRLNLGQTNSPLFENELKQALQKYQTNLALQKESKAEDVSLLKEINMLKECFEQLQSNVKDSIAVQDLLNQTCSSWFRWYFFNHIAQDSHKVNFYELTSYHLAADYLYLSDWARVCYTDHAFNKSNEATELNNIWKKLQDGLYCLFTHNKAGDNWNNTLPIVVTSSISSKPCSMQLDQDIKATFYEFSLTAQYSSEEDGASSQRSYFYIKPVDDGNGLIEIVAQIGSPETSDQDNSSDNKTQVMIRQPLRLQDFEYLRQLGDGLLPQSLSVECNSRFMLFKDRVFSKMVEKKSFANKQQTNKGKPKFMSLKDVCDLQVR